MRVSKGRKKSAKKAGRVPAGLHPIDNALLDAAQTGGGRVLTAEEWQTLRSRLAEQRDATDEELAALLASCPYDTRLAITAWVLRHLCDHAREGGTFRHLIYDRLDFGLDAYATLYLAGGMTLSNLFHNAREQGVLPVAPGDE
jgi:hypothetical protein